MQIEENIDFIISKCHSLQFSHIVVSIAFRYDQIILPSETQVDGGYLIKISKVFTNIHTGKHTNTLATLLFICVNLIDCTHSFLPTKSGTEASVYQISFCYFSNSVIKSRTERRIWVHKLKVSTNT
ncbi:unnamed protein product [Schistosoma rodhaini]|nr:unnamed protein product [Schistosoma rodhaini]